jgi:ubiquinone/menaquinone biosynthesis C-methylase UbiE
VKQETLTADQRQRQNARLRKAWDKGAKTYDKQMGWAERRIFGGGNREWACSRAQGEMLEVAVGTGLNLPLYDSGVNVTGIELSKEMLERARRRAAKHDLEADLREGDAHALPFDNASFDTVVCTFALCEIPDVPQAVAEMKRVLKPGGNLVLVDHVRSKSRAVFVIQKAIEQLSARLFGDYQTRRPLDEVLRQGFEISEHERFRFGGMVERVVATKPA